MTKLTPSRRSRLETEIGYLEELVKTDPLCGRLLKAKRTHLNKLEAAQREAESQASVT